MFTILKLCQQLFNGIKFEHKVVFGYNNHINKMIAYINVVQNKRHLKLKQN